jgi:hypothetical protein
LFAVVAGRAWGTPAELVPVLDLETAQTFPAGIWSPRVKFLTSPSDQKFDGNGNAVPAAASLNKSFTWRDVLSSQSPVQREALRALLQATPAIKETDLAGSVTADASTVTSAVVPILFWGVTDRLSFGLAVPVEHVDVRAVSGYVQGPSAQTLIDRACASSSPVKCQQIAQQLNQTLNTRLTQIAPGRCAPLRSLFAVPRGKAGAGAQADDRFPYRHRTRLRSARRYQHR